jgi:hypothetical protein
MFVPLPVVAIPFNARLKALFTVQANWLDCPGVMTEGEAVKDKITGIVKAAEVGIFPVDPLPLQADRAKMKRTIIIGVKDL